MNCSDVLRSPKSSRAYSRYGVSAKNRRWIKESSSGGALRTVMPMLLCKLDELPPLFVTFFLLTKLEQGLFSLWGLGQKPPLDREEQLRR
jgi:hypothetical protein